MLGLRYRFCYLPAHETNLDVADPYSLRHPASMPGSDGYSVTLFSLARVKAVLQGSGEYLQCLNPAGGSAYHDNVLLWHRVSVSHLLAAHARRACENAGPTRHEASGGTRGLTRSPAELATALAAFAGVMGWVRLWHRR